MGACDGEGGGKVGGGLGDAEAPHCRGEDILIGEAKFTVLLEDGNQHGEAVGVEAGDAAANSAGDAGGGKGLDLDEKAAGAGDDGAGGGAGTGLALFGEEAGAVGDFIEATCAHFEEADFHGGSEAVLDAPEDTMLVVAIAFEGEDDVDHMFEHARAGDFAFLGDVADEDDAGLGVLGVAHEAPAAAADLADGAGGGGEAFIVDHLDGINDEDTWAGGFDGGEEVAEFIAGED